MSRKLEYKKSVKYPVNLNAVTAMLRQNGVPMSVSDPALSKMAKETVLSAFFFGVDPVVLKGCVAAYHFIAIYGVTYVSSHDFGLSSNQFSVTSLNGRGWLNY